MGLLDWFKRKKTPKFTAAEQQAIITATRNQLQSLSRPASLAQIGGFRPTNDPLTSRFSGDFVMLESEVWPVFEGWPLQSILQINLSELPYVPPALTAYQLITIFIDDKDFPFDNPMGQGWEIRCYTSSEGLQARPNPCAKSRLKPFEIKWQLSHSEIPDWQDAESLIDLSEFHQLKDPVHEFDELFTHHELTKIGGWPSLIQYQLEMGAENCLIQIGSEPKANCNWIDGGNVYLGLVDGAWKLECQFF